MGIERDEAQPGVGGGIAPEPSSLGLEERLIREDIEAYLERYKAKELLRFVAVGSVDDGKSTLIGRLLHDTGMVYEDQLEAVRRASNLESDEIDFSLFTDGLRAEREQGITIDVAYRYFSTEKRKFIIADTPGHVQYTRNMVTGASTAEVAIILIDARLGVLQQSKRHAYIGSLLGIPHLAVCVNKMDLVGYDRQVFERIRQDFLEFAAGLRFQSVTFFPISALKGTNIVEPSPNTPWHQGPNVLEYLETVPIASDRNLDDFRFPVQCVLRPNLDYRGFAGEVASGIVRVGDEILALPSGKRSTIRSIDTFDGGLQEAFTPQAVTLRLSDEIDLSRGEMIVKADDVPRITRSFDAHLVWMSEEPADLQKTYVLKHTSQNVRGQVMRIVHRTNMDSLEPEPAEGLNLNDVARVHINTHRAIYCDGYVRNRSTGAFILVDSLTNDTVAAGMVIDAAQEQGLEEAMRELRAGSAMEFKTQVSPRERRKRFGQRGVTVWLTGLPGSGRWALAYALERRLFDLGRSATVVDPTGEDLRSMISAARAGTNAGLVTICAFPSYEQTDRQALRARIGPERVIQVYVNTDPALCRERRPDASFEGFEPPIRPEMTIALDQVTLEDAVGFVIAELERLGQFEDLD
ncbi:MAG: sulfate adenylyltransferase subunit CysN [Myxococcales bacterium]|nr:sulfate adenylyltransferase subunit CysN [Myxococcales bacterium]